MTFIGLSALVLLALSVVGAWWWRAAPAGLAGRPWWLGLHAAAVLAAMVAGNVQPMGAAALCVLLVLGWAASRTAGTCQGVCTGATAMLALALALHRVPGFDNPRLLDGIHWRPDAVASTLYANIDKASAGLILFAFLAPRRGDSGLSTQPLSVTLTGMVAVPALVLGSAWAAGVVAPQAGWPGPPGQPQAAQVFLAVNLLFTCVAEEAFFRGLLQDRLMRVLPGRAVAQWAAVVVSALLFGAAHLGGGMGYAALAALAGLGYALVYAHTRTVESAVAVHFAVNAVHLLAFTYPRLA